MFNETKVVTEINHNIGGIIKKLDEKSFFIKFHQNSRLADNLFEPNPKYKDKPISIIQMMLINGGEILAECIYI